jgi:PKHD-type hydroxylase
MYTIPEFNTPLEPLVCLSESFIPEELESIIKMGDRLEFSSAKIGGGGGEEDPTVRKSKITWILPDEENRWLFNKMAEVVARINNDKYQFNLSHFDAFQYTTYIEGELYDWHIDGGDRHTPIYGANHRKLGFTLLLADPETEFTGGEFQIIPGGNPNNVDSIPMKKGDIAAFPSFLPHRVSEVKSGKRKSLVFWVQGSKFK